VFVIGVNSCLRGSDVGAHLPGRDELYGGDDDWMSEGNAAIAGPDGTVLAGPLVGEAATIMADLDLTRCARSGSSSTPRATTRAAMSWNSQPTRGPPPPRLPRPWKSRHEHDRGGHGIGNSPRPVESMRGEQLGDPSGLGPKGCSQRIPGLLDTPLVQSVGGR
jgi:hypothetical protein